MTVGALMLSGPVMAQSMEDNVDRRMDRRQQGYENWQNLSPEQQQEYKNRYRENSQERRSRYQENAPERRDAARDKWNSFSSDQQNEIKNRAQNKREQFGGPERRQERRGFRRGNR